MEKVYALRALCGGEFGGIFVREIRCVPWQRASNAELWCLRCDWLGQTGNSRVASDLRRRDAYVTRPQIKCHRNAFGKRGDAMSCKKFMH